MIASHLLLSTLHMVLLIGFSESRPTLLTEMQAPTQTHFN